MNIGDVVICKSKFDIVNKDDTLIIKEIYVDGSLKLKNENCCFTLIRSSFNNYFITLAEWRDIQMKNILE